MTPISVAEPSGLALSFNKSFFWCVGDNDNKVYKLDKKGNILDFFTIAGEDFEGITIVDSTRIAIILERTREVVLLDSSGKELKRKKLDIKGNLNEGLEGICFDA